MNELDLKFILYTILKRLESHHSYKFDRLGNTQFHQDLTECLIRLDSIKEGE